MSKQLAFYFLVLLCVCYAVGLDLNNCPLSSKMTSCSPKCKDDSDCYGKRCCPNICSTKSCVPDHIRVEDGYRNKNTATGSYCGNVKCNSFQKCEMDRSTKRPRCVRK